MGDEFDTKEQYKTAPSLPFILPLITCKDDFQKYFHSIEMYSIQCNQEMGEEFNTKQQYKSDHPHSLSTSKHIYGVTFILSK